MTETLRKTADRVRALMRVGARLRFTRNDGGGYECWHDGEHCGTIDKATGDRLLVLKLQALEPTFELLNEEEKTQLLSKIRFGRSRTQVTQ